MSKIRAIADEDTTVIMIPIDAMRSWFDTNDSWRSFILQSYQIRFDEMLETIDTLAFMKMDERLFKYLTDKVKLSASTDLEITHQEIAEDLHTSRVVVSRLLKQLEKQDVLVLDELGYVPFSKAGAELLFEVVSRAYERSSLIVTTNLPFENWVEVMGNERLTGALLDRLTHRVHILEANGESYRLKEAKRRRKTSTKRSAY